MIARIPLALSLLLLAACSDGRQSPEPSGTPAPATAPAQPEPAAPAAPAPPPEDPDHIQADGLSITIEDNGRIHVVGTDRWGRPLDQTYEDATFFRGAAEVLQRSVSDENAPLIRRALTRLDQREGPAAAAPAPEESGEGHP